VDAAVLTAGALGPSHGLAPRECRDRCQDKQAARRVDHELMCIIKL